jgi:hypothetical protein
MSVPHAGTGKPVFPAVLEVVPVEVDIKLEASYNPDRAFKADFSKELREGAIAYFDRIGMFAGAREAGGDLSLKMRVVNYEASRNADPQKIMLQVGTVLTDVKKNHPILFGVGGAQTIIPVNDLFKLTEVSPQGGGKGWVMERGALEMAEICLRIYRNIEKQFRLNREQIIRELQ